MSKSSNDLLGSFVKGRIEPRAVSRNKILISREGILLEKIKEVVNGYPATGQFHKMLLNDEENDEIIQMKPHPLCSNVSANRIKI